MAGAAGLGLVAGLLIGWRTADRPPAPAPDAKQPVDQANAPPKKETPGQGAEEKGTLIPLSEIYSPSGQRQLAKISAGDALAKRLSESLAPVTFITASSLTAESARTDTLEVFNTHRRIPDLSLQEGDEPLKLWAFVYLGTQAENDPFWELTQVRQHESELVVGYAQHVFFTTGEGEVIPYCYWIPLKTPPPGIFTIRLIETPQAHLFPTGLLDLRINREHLVVRTRLLK
jgi:hypothetical protein